MSDRSDQSDMSDGADGARLAGLAGEKQARGCGGQLFNFQFFLGNENN